jgi:UDP-glucuronate 4-epimerase
MPYAETAKADTQMSFYAATKKATEAMAHSYAHLYDLPTTMFRFFTVYGPWGRPDMAPYKFTRAILAGEEIDVYNHGQMSRDFTYIDDLVDGIVRLIEAAPVRPETAEDVPEGDSLSPVAPYRIVNIGNSEPVALMDFIGAIEAATGMTAQEELHGHAAGRCACHLGRRNATAIPDRLSPQNGHPGRRRPLGVLVSRLLRRLSKSLTDR